MARSTLARSVVVPAVVVAGCVAAGALPAVASATAGATGATPLVTAHVNPVATWQPVSALKGGLGAVDQPSLVRSVVGGKPYLFVAWHRRDTPSTESIRTRVIASNGSLYAPQVAVSGWAGLDPTPALVGTPSGPSVVFGGQKSTLPNQTQYTGYMAAADWSGVWSLNGNAFGASPDAHDSEGTSATFYSGSIVNAFPAPSGSILVHQGSDGGNPSNNGVANTPDIAITEPPGTSTYDSALAVDPGTGTLWAAWYVLNDSNHAINGVRYAPVLPTTGPANGVPGGHTALGQSVQPDQRVAIAGVNTGVWVAYTSGYPSGAAILLYNLRTHRRVTVPASANSDQVGLAAAPGGRLWVFWTTAESNAVHAVRTNAAVTAFEPVQTVAAPDDVFATAGEGTPGPLDLVINGTVRPGSSDNELFYRRFLARFTARASYHRGVVTVSVTDAGTPVKGATVTYGGHSVATNAAGVGAIFVGGGGGVRKITVTDAGYWGTVLTVRAA